MAEAGSAAATRPIVVLGSASPARRTLLRTAGIDPVVLHSEVDEEALVAAAGAQAADPHWLTEHLARAKAADVAARIRDAGLPGMDLPGMDLPQMDLPQMDLPGMDLPQMDPPEMDPPERDSAGPPVLVIGADSLLAFDGQVLGKAPSAQAVRDRWAAMAGRVGELVTGHVVVEAASGRTVTATVGTTIRFGRPDPVELEAYIASGEPLAVAGSCTIDGLGGAFIDGIDGDHGNVIGLSLPTLRLLVTSLGWRWTDLWRPRWAGPGHAP